MLLYELVFYALTHRPGLWAYSGLRCSRCQTAAMDSHIPPQQYIETASYFELSWAILSSIGLFAMMMGVWAVLITRPSPLSYIPIVVSAACALSNGLCYFAYYTSYSTTNRAIASALADLLWLVRAPGHSPSQPTNTRRSKRPACRSSATRSWCTRCAAPSAPSSCPSSGPSWLPSPASAWPY